MLTSGAHPGVRYDSHPPTEHAFWAGFPGEGTNDPRLPKVEHSEPELRISPSASRLRG